MTKWICNGCHGWCEANVSGHLSPVGCLLFPKRETKWERDCTTEERSSAVFDAFAGVDNRVCHLEKKVQEIERELKNHYHDTGFPK